jgi:hypothetical protein
MIVGGHTQLPRAGRSCGYLTAAEAGGKPGRHAHPVAGTRRCLGAEGAVDLAGDHDLRDAVT